MTGDDGFDGLMHVTVKRNSNKKVGFEVAKRKDGFYYVTKVPDSCTVIHVGDRVLEINGTKHPDFKNEANANTLIDSFRIEVIPVDENDEEIVRLRSGEKTSRDGSSKDDSSIYNQSSQHSCSDEADAIKKFSLRSDDDDDDWSRTSGDEDWSDSSESVSESGNYVSGSEEELDWDEDKNVAVENKGWDRPFVSSYKPNDKFMLTITKLEGEDGRDLGLDLREFNREEENGIRTDIYVKEVARGPFFRTALDIGDKILSINGRKISKDINSIEEAVAEIRMKTNLTLYVVRPSKADEGYKWVTGQK